MNKPQRAFDLGSLRREKRKEQALKVTIYAVLILSSLPIILGYWWLFVQSFNRRLSFSLWPTEPTLENWHFLWERPMRSLPELWPVFWNTVELAVGVTVLVVLIATPAGYALSRLKFRGRHAFLTFTLILHAFPGISLLIALFWVLQRLGLLNTIAGVYLVQAGLFMPFAIWVMKGFFDGIPWDVEMSALVDGAGRFKTWYRIMLPQVRPGMAAIAIFAFITGWSTYIYVIVFILKQSKWTLAKYVAALIDPEQLVDWGLVAAVGVFYILPVLLFFLFTQKYLLKVTIGGMKGGG